MGTLNASPRPASATPEGLGPYDWAPRKPAYDLAKRAVDVAFALIALVLLSPVWLLLALLIRATSPGPALFRRTAIGRAGQPFTYYKFRSMVAGDDSHHRAWLERFVTSDAPYQGDKFKVTDDPRVTRIGRLLRRTSLDEVPQLINVLQGEMSVVGPRPPITHEFELYDDAARRRLAVKPGITGLYQVSARSQVPFSGMVALDIEYIGRRSIGLDLGIMLRTALVMASGRGAG
jgi:lipopolysaccharide/colanic/teichoic acid biosynthesis glycosyltransferase